MAEYPAGYRQWPQEENESLQVKHKYRTLKRKLRCLLYEQECFQEELRRLQRKLLRVNRDKSFLLDRLLQYEPPEFSSSDEEDTASSAEEGQHFKSYWNSQVPVHGPEPVPAKKAPSAGHASSSQEAKSLQKSKKSADSFERVRCKKVENGKRCPKMVSRRVKSGLCLVHRGGDVKKANQNKSNPSQHIPNTVQPRAAVDFFSQPNPMISGISNDHAPPPASATISSEMYNIHQDIHQESNAADSPASSDFHSNIYEGDDDLVIDLPE
eukprot:Seg652.5 transcript_id=Seg652.5/GoldUCD/mRNA.D3Y31 product="INO80 complex subunit E" protein_id=Seg652.5/GoldUCD/D3Y31